MKNQTTFEVPTKIEIKSVKHTFPPHEMQEIGKELARTFQGKAELEGEFDKVKSEYKAKLAEKDSRATTLAINLVNGFELRSERCFVRFIPARREKEYFLEAHINPLLLEEVPKGGFAIPVPVLVEPMTAEDFQTELLQAESKFDKREEIALFPTAGTDFGTLIVGKFGHSWFSALRIKVGKQELTERLDSEQRSFKERAGAIKIAGKRAMEWIKEKFKDNAKGFEEPMAKALAEQAERAE